MQRIRDSFKKTKLNRASALAAILLLSACGGGGGGDNDNTLVVPPSTSGDTIAPTLAILTPDDDGDATVTQTTVSVTGMASDNVGVQSLSWRNTRGGQGSISVSDNWRSPSITLLDGSNLIIVTAQDAAGNQTEDRIAVTRAASTLPDDDATARISYSSDLSGAGLLSGATVEQRFAYLFFEPGQRWNDVGVTRVDFYCCKALTGQTMGHLPRVIDNSAPFSLGIDLGQFESGTTRELYADIYFADGTQDFQLVEFSLESGSGASNTAPTISGSPQTSTMTDQNYSFVPTANDADGDMLTFQIQNRPSWASFDSATGQLSGSPDSNDVGDYSNIRISVTDGRASASLPAFSIEVQAVARGSVVLNWNPPTTRVNGTAIGGLQGYRIFYGRESGVYENNITVNNGGLTTYTIDNLPGGTYYLAMTAIDLDNRESNLSYEVVKNTQ